MVDMFVQSTYCTSVVLRMAAALADSKDCFLKSSYLKVDPAIQSFGTALQENSKP